MDLSALPRYVPATDPQSDKRPLYRYLDSQWVELFRNERKLRVQMLKKYRDIGDVRQDATEGITTTLVRGSGHLSREKAKALGLDVASATFEPGWNGTLKHNMHFPNGYMVCTSTTLGTHLLKRFRVNGYFTITNTELFKRALARAVCEQVKIEIVGSDKVTYVQHKERSRTMTQVVTLGSDILRPAFSDYFKKTRSYKVEAEYRFVFLTDSQDAPPYLDLQLTPAEIEGCCRFN